MHRVALLNHTKEMIVLCIGVGKISDNVIQAQRGMRSFVTSLHSKLLCN